LIAVEFSFVERNCCVLRKKWESPNLKTNIQIIVPKRTKQRKETFGRSL